MSRGVPKSGIPLVRLRRELRLIRLRELGYCDYPEYLRSAHWADKRREYQSSDLPQDCMCGATEGIQFHHLTYERIGREKLSDLTPVCPTCHAMLHALEARGDIDLDLTGFVDTQRAERYLAERQNRDEPFESWELAHREQRARRLAKQLSASIKAVALDKVARGEDPQPVLDAVSGVVREHEKWLRLHTGKLPEPIT